MNKDLFGYQNQGVKYDIYRPKYPNKMLAKMVQRMKNKNRYLDVATGTGQIIFEICNQFHQAEGIDISKKMIEVCLKKTQQRSLQRVQFKCEDFMTAGFNQKYDLITIGQALHWLPIRQFFQKSKSLLTEQGQLNVFGYILNRIEGETAGETKNFSDLYFQFYDKRVKPNFDFNRDELHTHYSDKQRYPFQQVFAKVSRQIVEVPIEMDKNGFLSYLRTFSGYNTYLQRFTNEKDPILYMEAEIPPHAKIKCIFDYFCITCSTKAF